MRRLAPAAVLAAASAALLSALLVASPAQAHNFLVSSTPAAGETLTTLPELFEITTNDELLYADGSRAFALQVIGPDGRFHGDGCLTVDGPTMSTPAALGESGEYTIDWQVVSADGHTVSDTIEFRWAPEAGQTVSAGVETAPACEPAASDAAVPAASAAASTAASRATTAPGDSDALWIAGAVVAVLAAAGITLAVTRRRQ